MSVGAGATVSTAHPPPRTSTLASNSLTRWRRNTSSSVLLFALASAWACLQSTGYVQHTNALGQRANQVTAKAIVTYASRAARKSASIVFFARVTSRSFVAASSRQRLCRSNLHVAGREKQKRTRHLHQRTGELAS